MPRNGSGVYSLPEPPFVSGTVISSAAMNDDLSDIATALTGSLPRDGQAGMSGQLKLADGSVGAPSLAFSTDLTTGLFKGGSGIISVSISGVQVGTFTSAGWSGSTQGSVPIGAVMDFMGASTPSQWILCFGQNVSRTTYAALFTALGTTYGAGDGITTFGLPDLRGRATYGLDNMGGSAASRLTTAFFTTNPTVLGNAGGSQSTGLIAANIPSLTSSGTPNITVVVNSGSNLIATTTGSISNGAAASPGGLAVPISGSGNWASITTISGTTANSISLTSTGTSGTTFSNTSPGMVVNKIIFAGV
jgi:microcystin-dependent protein